ncbi:MAG: hypothetical protein M1838_003340 [Thelocarpon superellum]|nr:MAG: hypothetical protein M1838_003340 [Thelocarpon superellum]
MDPSILISFPDAAVFEFPPAPLPNTLPPPPAEFVHAPAFPIPTTVFHNLLSVYYPATIALVYATTVVYLNGVNQQRGGRPWAFSHSSTFFGLVITHNIFLAIYSGWTFFGMCLMFNRVWPGLSGEHGLAAAMESICHIHGPKGLGNAVLFNTTAEAWTVMSPTVKLIEGAVPSNLDAGRMWNEGLAFYGWLFYISKFYEVVDTAIILAKGKQSSTLQLFHHTGAMFCMWAGIRYMAPPIAMFVTVNSGIHAMMYMYYTLTALGTPIPVVIKRTLTTMQIMQFLAGTSGAIAYLFVRLTVPVSVPYTVTSSVPSAMQTAVTATATAGLVNLLKKLAFRAAGEEGLAENVAGQHRLGGSGDVVREETRYREEYRTVPCIGTSGEAFAIWFNITYLIPLTWLFVKFFIKSYSRRTSSSSRARTSTKAGHDAVKGLNRQIGTEASTNGSVGNGHAANGVAQNGNASNGTVPEGEGTES